jgi:predicted transcriptional regulator
MAQKSSPRPYPTDSELAILQVLWRRGPSSVREVWDELGQKSGYTTVLKLMQIMLEKKLVRRDDREFTHVYEAAATREETEQHLVGELIDRAFSGSASKLMLRALAAKPVSSDELKAIRELLAQAEKKRS